MGVYDKKARGKSPAASQASTQVAATPGRSERIRYYRDALLSSRILGITCAVLAGAALTAGTTYALVLRVQHLVATASVSSDPVFWMQASRTRAYDPCYYGCTDDCSNPSWPYDSCAKTASVNVPGVVCDGSLMWNWKNRYPIECLQALGEIYKAEELEALKNSYPNQLGLVVLTILGGLVGGIVVYKVWRRLTQRMKLRAWEKRWDAEQWPRPFAAPAWTRVRGRDRRGAGESEKAFQGTSSPGRLGASRQPKLRFFGAALGLSSVSLPPAVKAYSCTGFDPSYDQYFANANQSVVGVVHGWYSNCHDIQRCQPSCTQSCSASSSGSQSCSTTCSQVCWTETHSNKAPVDFVRSIMPKVQACGFAVVDAVESDVNLRLANAAIEKNWWVKISLNGYNISSADETDESVWCLHDIGNSL